MSTADSPSTVAPALPAVTGHVARLARGAAFWSGIALAFAQLPLLVGGVTADRPVVLTALLAVNVLVMALGSGHRT